MKAKERRRKKGTCENRGGEKTAYNSTANELSNDWAVYWHMIVVSTFKLPSFLTLCEDQTRELFTFSEKSKGYTLGPNAIESASCLKEIG